MGRSQYNKPGISWRWLKLTEGGMVMEKKEYEKPEVTAYDNLNNITGQSEVIG